ncbi:hypothetical protein ACVBGC_22770 [Burkholderia stagnalis]
MPGASACLFRRESLDAPGSLLALTPTTIPIFGEPGGAGQIP